MNPRWRTGTVASQGETIYYEVTGEPDAPTILLTHGAGGSHAAWFQQVPALAAAGYQVITWDCRGFGLSTLTTGVFSSKAAVVDMVAVLDAAGVQRAHVAGQSMGGWWVTAFTIAHPERVRTLTLSNTVGGLWTDALDEHFKKRVMAAAETEPRLGEHTAIAPGFAERDPAGAFLYQQLNTFHSPPMGAVAGAIMTGRITHDALDVTGVPILVITGSDDALFPAKLVRATAEQLANARVVEIADAGHSPYFERPDQYNAALLEFVDANPGAVI